MNMKAHLIGPPAAIALMLLLAGCESTPGGSPDIAGRSSAGASRLEVCRQGDRQVSSASQCLQDDAACYQLSDGSYCTGPRGNVCPTGSVALPKGSPCPAGARCFAISSGLNCTINYQ